MHGSNLVDAMAIVGLVAMLIGVFMWLGVWATVALAGAVLLVFAVRLASNAG